MLFLFKKKWERLQSTMYSKDHSELSRSSYIFFFFCLARVVIIRPLVFAELLNWSEISWSGRKYVRFALTYCTSSQVLRKLTDRAFTENNGRTRYATETKPNVIVASRGNLSIRFGDKWPSFFLFFFAVSHSQLPFGIIVPTITRRARGARLAGMYNKRLVEYRFTFANINLERWLFFSSACVPSKGSAIVNSDLY